MPKAQRNETQNLEKFVINICKAFWIVLTVCFYGAKKINYKSIKFWLLYIGITLLIFGVTINNCIYLKGLYYALPGIFNLSVIKLLLKLSPLVHFIFWITILTIFIHFIYGFKDYSLKRKYQNKLDELGLKNAKGIAPKIVKVIEFDEYKTKLIVLSSGIGIEKYTQRKNDFEMSLQMIVEGFRITNDKKHIEILITKKQLTKLLKYSEIAEINQKPSSFIVGESLSGTITKSIRDLPHLLIAGTTGGGKSVFFKQMLLGLLKSSQHLQMYLIDLKMGVEVKEFSELKNVEVAKNEIEAVNMLSDLKDEMNERFLHLEKTGHKFIEPKRDKMDLIVVGIDEASVLYGKEKRDSSKKELMLKARELTDELAKLARAAGIHLIFATQKVTKETIDTKVQENIGGRMCFRMNSLPGSMTVLGNKKAYALPDIKGRAIWTTGNKFYEVQAPFISEEEIKEEIELLKNNEENENFKNFGEMIRIRAHDKEEADDACFKHVKSSKRKRKIIKE